MAGDFDLSDGDWEESVVVRERKRTLKAIDNMHIHAELGQYEAGWNDALTRLKERIVARGME